MGRTTKVLAFPVPPAIARQIERTAKEERKTKSEMLLAMWEAYRVTREKEEFSGLVDLRIGLLETQVLSFAPKMMWIGF